MQSDWRQVTLGEFVRLQRGHDLTASEQRPGQFPVMGSAGPNGTHAEFKAFGPGVVIGRSGASMGRVHFCETDYWPHNTCLYVTDFLENNPLFAFYKLAELNLARYNSGSAQPSLNRNYIYGMSLWIPSRHIQDQIVRVVHSIDKKIDLYHRINQTLEAMAQAIFQSWFVDFDPVKAKITAKAEGSDPLRAAMSAISGKADAELDALPPEQYEQLAATAALFPDEMEDSELGAIPKGWTVCPLPECVDINPSRVLKKGAIAPYLDMANVPTHAARVDNVVPRAFGSGSKFINGDTLLARITPCLENGKTAYVDFLADGEVGWGSTEFIVLRPKNGLPLPFAYFLCRHPEFRAFAISQMAGTSGRQRVPNDCFGAYKVVKPSPLVADAFGLQTTQFMKQIKSLDEASKTLAGLRDVLLPRLLSGELQVQHTEPEAVA